MKKVLGRDTRIDILRAIAIIGIIIAHSEPNGIIIQLRNFDVVLMVLLLGTSFYLSNSNKNIYYPTYLIKRFKRLIVPTWIFLTIFFVLFYLISLAVKTSYYFIIQDIVKSYTMINGIGYVWIMSVFFLIALISPLLLKLNLKVKSNNYYFIVLFLIYIVYVFLQLMNESLNGPIRVLFEHFVLYGIGYGLIAAFGMRLKFLSSKEIYLWIVIFLTIFLSFMSYYNFSPTQNYKYPPQLYYISYGMFVSLLLYVTLNIKLVHTLFNNKFIMFIAQHSIWLYFWHIIFIYLLKFFGENLSLVANNFITRFGFIFFCALFITYIHNLMKKKLFNSSENIKGLRKVVIK